MLIFEKVRDLAGDWIPVIPIPGSFVCNIGDMLKVCFVSHFLIFLTFQLVLKMFFESYTQILSNGVYESTLHRVINNSPRYRVCVGFFYEVLNL